MNYNKNTNIKIKYVGSFQYTSLEENVNKWLTNNSNLEILDIKINSIIDESKETILCVFAICKAD